MGATSVTGLSGPGDSEGKYKPANNCGCGCGDAEEEERKEVKLGCYTRYTAQGNRTYRVSGGSASIKVC